MCLCMSVVMIKWKPKANSGSEMSSLKFQFGGFLAVMLCWALLEWVPASFIFRHPNTGHVTSTMASLPATRTQPTDVSWRRDATVRVLIASDGFCLGGLVSAVNSVLQHTRHDVKFYVVTTVEELPHLRKWIEATKLHKMTYELHALTALGLQHVKIRATELFPELGGRLVYLDCDVIVQGDIWELFSADIRPGHYGAFSQKCVGSAADMPVRKPRYGSFVNLRAPNMGKDDCPFATGVFVANLTLWRWHRVAEKMQHWIAVHRREKIVGIHPTADVVEAAMLIVLHGNVTVLDPMWHVQHLGASYNSRYSKQFIESAKLLHWSGRFKPWSHRAAHAQVWDRYYIPDPTGQFRPARKRDPRGVST